MKECGWIEPIVERVVGQVLESQVTQLRSEIVRRVMEEIAAAPAEKSTHNAPAVGSGSAPADLARAVAEIQLGTSQREILRALLDTSARYAARVALFVVKGSHATGWQARGFANSDAVKDFALDDDAPAVGRAIGERIVAVAAIADLDARFLKTFGSPASGEGRVLPLLLKDKVAALVYADAGSDDAPGVLDAGSLELLVLSTSAWLEVNSLRKQAQKESSAAPAEPHSSDGRGASAAAAPPSQPVPQSGPALNDPFAAHAPAFASHAKAAAASSSAVEAPVMASEAHSFQSAVVETESALPEPLPVSHAGNEPADSGVPPETPAAAGLSPEDQEVHRKALRFARLLVDEIKLYNQAKVAEGRKKKDLYDRLKEAIEKSRATYQKRYGNTAAASANYFQHEIIRSLAEDDLSIMGANFRH
ncbi:MAG: hypothetical protein ABSG02_16810 [Terriglobales bacterium]